MSSGTETPRVTPDAGLRARLTRRQRTAPRPGEPPARPALLPARGWARTALLLLLVFTLCRSLLWADFFPAFWAPDEDYHFLFADHVAMHGSLPDPDEPLYPEEYTVTTNSIQYLAYAGGPRTSFEGDPQASLDEVAALPDSSREGTATGRGVGIVHPPLYHAVAGAANWLTGDAPMQTRLTWVRYATALFAVLAVYAAWLLAAQVLRRESHQFLVALLVAVQPMIGFLSGVANHDSALIAFFTLALALMLFALRTAPRAVQGLWLGGAIALALMVKSSALALLPLAGLAYLAQAITWRSRWREAVKAGLIAAAVVAVVAGWWYVRSRIVYGTFSGVVAGDGPGNAEPGAAASLSQLFTWSKEWTGTTYRTYWWHYHWFEAPARTSWYYVPAFVGFVGMLGLLGALWSSRRSAFDPSNPRLRQILLLLIGAVSLYGAFLWVDLGHKSDGGSFFMDGGRYLLPAYAAAATLFVVGLLHLVRREARPFVLGAVGALATFFSLRVFEINYVHRYFGDESLGELLRRVSYDRPPFVTPETLGVLLVLIVASFAAFVVVVARGARRSASEPGP